MAASMRYWCRSFGRRMASPRAVELYAQARLAPNAKRRVRLTLLGNLESAASLPDSHIVWLYVGPGKVEDGALLLGDLRVALRG